MLKLKNLKLTINDGIEPVQVLKGINLQLEKKKIYVMTGPNGGGKTSIAKSIMGIYQPSAGQIILDGLDITNKSIRNEPSWDRFASTAPVLVGPC